MIEKNKQSFNANQLEAIEHREGPAMVIAGPGSGKTTVITNRIRRLIEDGAALPGEILVITFTSAAASEMRQRYLKLQSIDETKVVFGTFHSVFLNIIRTYSSTENIRLGSDREFLNVLRDTATRVFPEVRFTSDYLEMMLNEIGRMKNGLKSVNPYAVKLCEPYAKALYQNRLMDFDDMLLMCYKLLKENTAALAKLRNQFKYIMVDEFQDINPVQFETVKLIASPRNNLFVVGDDDQSIYGFRGSDPGIMLSFRQHFPKAKYIGLFLNYRSDAYIIKSSLKLIEKNKMRYQKSLETTNEDGLKIITKGFYDQTDEAKYVAERIKELSAPAVRAEGSGKFSGVAMADDRKYKSFGILARTHKAAAAVRTEIEKMEAEGFTEESGVKVSVMTFHASKGLEFDVVFLVNADDGITPSASSGTAGLEEERRLFYVAMTRAKRVLHISYTKYFYNKKCKRSRFIGESGSGRLF